MKLKSLFLFHALVALPYGLGGFFFPAKTLSLMMPSAPDPSHLILAQILSAALIALSAMALMARKLSDVKSLRVITTFYFIFTVGMAITELRAQLFFGWSQLNWISPILGLILVAGYGYHRFIKLR